MPDFLDSLNERQRQAVCHEDGGLLVLAGAGTGKTRVLAYRCAWLMREQQCPPWQILAVTFTNKAAKEMRERISAVVPYSVSESPTPYRARELVIGTFHGICHRMLRRHADVAGWDKNFQILDSQDQKNFIRRLLEENNLDDKEFPPSECRYFINNAKESGQRAADIVPAGPYDRRFLGVYEYYEAACRRENKMDFSELLLSAVDLLRGNRDLRKHYAARFRHILIDEMQDTNPMQYAWLKLLDAGDNHYFAVGDDDQSIYAFRGADPGNMRKMQKELRANNIVRLEENYRSTGNILNAANALIATNRNRLGKNLFTRGGGGALLRVLRHYADLDESAATAAAIRDDLHGGKSADDIAVLYRTNAQSRLLEKSLIENGVPYRIYGGTRFFERQEIKHALAYLRLAVTDDNDALLRVINMPPRGIGGRTIESLMQEGSLVAGVRTSALPKTVAFRMMLEKWRALRETAGDDALPQLARAVVVDSGLLAYYQSRSQDLERADNLQEFVSAAEQFEKDSEDEETLSAFLANAVLQSGEAESEQSGAAVNLMTVHAAKGLEFATVFVTGLEEGLFPSSQSLDSGSVADVEEERRLMYVAITRAKADLFLSFADSRMVFGNVQRRPPSRFIEELPSDLLQSEGIPPRHHVFASPSRQHFSAKSRTTKLRVAKPPQGNIAPPITYGGKVAADDNPSYRPGASVRHPKYGVGVLVRREGRGEELKVEVAFKRVGSKTFLLAASPLQLA